MRKYVVLFEKSSDGYGAYVPDLPGCVAIGGSREETEKLIYEAIRIHIDAMEKDNLGVPPAVTECEVMVFFD